MTLAEVRINIDRVDQQIKQLFQERMGLAEQVAQVKARTGDCIYKPDREAAIIDRLTADVKPEIKKEYTALIRRIMEVSRKYQYGRTLELRDGFDISWDTEEKADAETCRRILTKTGGDEQAEFFHMLAEGQLYMNRCEMTDAGNTNSMTAEFSNQLIVRPEHNHFEIAFKCADRCGALAAILTMISDYQVNMTGFLSRPDGKSKGNCEFYAELDGNLLNKEMQALVFQLENETEEFHLLGSYEL